MSALDPVKILNHFFVDAGGLYRRQADNTVRRITTVSGNRLVVVFEGHRLNGNDVAWICHHGFPSPYPVVTINMDPKDMSVDNLAPVRRTQIRYRQRYTLQGYRHPLNKHEAYATPTLCRLDWIDRAYRYYSPDIALVVKQHAELAQQFMEAARAALAEVQAARKPYRAPKKFSPRPGRPDCPEGFEVHWYKGQWVTIPVPVHVSDDWMVRAEACLANPGARFRFDATLQRTVQV